MLYRLILFFVLLLASNANAVTYWAAPGGSGGSNCTLAQDENTPASSATIAIGCAGATGTTGGANDIVILKTGNYDESLNNRMPSGSSSSNRFQIRCEIRRTCVVRPGEKQHAIGWDSGSNHNYVTVTGIKFDGRNLYMTGGFRSGAGSTTFSVDVIVEDSEFVNFGSHAVSGGSMGGTWRRNKFGNSCTNYDNLPHFCQQLYIGNYTAGTVVDQNEFVGSVGGYGYHAWGSPVTSMENHIITRNIFNNPGSVRPGAFSSSRGAIYYNNIFIQNGLLAYSGGIEVNAVNQQIWNNTFYGHSGVNASYAIRNGNGTTLSGTVCKNNLAISSGGTPISNCATVDQNATTGVAANIFEDHTNRKFCLKAGATATVDGVASTNLIDNGATSGAPVGLTWNGTAPSIGACDPIPPPTATANDSATTIVFPIGIASYTPILPASGHTGFTFDLGRTIKSSSRPSGNTLSFVLSACGSGTFSYTPGNITSNLVAGDPNGIPITQQLLPLSSIPITGTCGGGGTSIPPGLHVHYKFDEGSGTTANDETAPQINGTITGATYVPGRTGTALQFAANSTNNVAFAFGSGINPTTQALAYAFDFMPLGTPSNEVWFGAPVGVNQRQHVGRDSFTNTLGLGVQSSGIGGNTEFAVVTGSWHRLCVNIYPAIESPANTVKLYLMGTGGTTAQSVKTFTSYTLSGNFEIGRLPGSTTDGNVIIDNFKLWTNTIDCLAEFKSEWPDVPDPAGTYTQVAWDFHFLRKNAAGNLIKVAGPAVPINSEINVPISAVITLSLQIDCTIADCAPIAFLLQHENVTDTPNTWNLVSDNCALDWCYYGPTDSDPNIVGGDRGSPLSGSLTYAACDTMRTENIIPSVDMVQNGSTVCRYLIKHNSTQINKQYRFRLIDQNGAVLNGGYGTSCANCAVINTKSSFAGGM